MITFLKKVPFFTELSDQDLVTLAESVETITLTPGEYLFHERDEGKRAFIIKSGEVEILQNSGGREILLAVREEGVIIGEMSLLQSIPRTASVRARTEVILYTIDKVHFDNLVNNSKTALRTMFHTILSRYQENQAQIRQSEKMAQLGTLTAGVAHELNNPAAAVNRGADQLAEAVIELEGAINHSHHLGFTQEQEDILNALVTDVRSKASDPPELDSMVRADREYAIETWLEDNGVGNAWEIAPNLVNINFNEENLAELTNTFETDKLPCVINVLNGTFTVTSLISEINQGSAQISSIVKALKAYSFLDQAPVQSVDVHEGIGNTLMILKNKIKQGVNVKQDFDPDLPTIEAYGSELNQVWTNLLDNAIDALENTENAEIIIRSRQEGNWVVVDIEDNGPGISEENQKKVFDAFFTTKPVGKGTGMGLDITYRIIVQKHKGDIKLQSKPGQTIFSVWLPI